MTRGELSPGDRCEAYRIVRLIAAGGTGEVYDAVHEPSGQRAAIKCLKIAHRSRGDACARMKMEAVVLSELKHANLVRVYDAGVLDGGTIWIAMERLQGMTLRQRIFETGAMPVAEALHVACEVADGVDALHAVRVIHRDLKPENLFLTEDGQLKVLDLGTGKFHGYGLHSTDRMRIVGTTAYMAPEQIKGLELDSRVDVYALGLIAYEMLTGRHALLSVTGGELPDDMERLVVMQLQVEPAPLHRLVPDLPPYVSSVVAHALSKDRALRPVSMSEFGRELRVCRKRYLAESHTEEGTRGSHPPVADLRLKLGARIPSHIPLERPAATPDRLAFGAGQGCAVERSSLPAATEPTTPGLGGSTDPLVQTVPTDHLVASSVASPIGIRAAGSPVHLRTTNTNPLWSIIPALSAAAREPPLAHQTPSTGAVAVTSRRSPRRSYVRRLGWTVLLGALLGLPLALLAIWFAGPKNPSLAGVYRAGESVVDRSSTIERVRLPSRAQARAVGPARASEGDVAPSPEQARVDVDAGLDHSPSEPAAVASSDPSGRRGARHIAALTSVLPSSEGAAAGAVSAVGGRLGAKRGASAPPVGANSAALDGTPASVEPRAPGVLLSPEWVGYPSAPAQQHPFASP